MSRDTHISRVTGAGLTALLLLLAGGAAADHALAQTDCFATQEVIQAGIFGVDNSNIVVRMRPSVALSGCNVAAASVVVRWPNVPGDALEINALTNGSGMPSGLPWQLLDATTSGGFDYAWIATIPAAPPSGSFASGVEYDMVDVEFNREGSESVELVATSLAQTVFTSAAGWAFQYTTANKANNTDEFYQDQTSLPVELTAFTAALEAQDIILSWRTASETGNAGFEIQYTPVHCSNTEVAQSESDAEVEEPRESSWSRLGFVAGAGTSREEQEYSFRASGLEVGSYQFRLRQVDVDGASAYSDGLDVTVAVPGEYLLGDVYPNPFNPRARFSLAVREEQEIRIDLFDVLGRHVTTLFDDELPANETRHFTVNGDALASGLLLLRVTGQRFAAVRTMMRCMSSVTASSSYWFARGLPSCPDFRVSSSAMPIRRRKTTSSGGARRSICSRMGG